MLGCIRLIILKRHRIAKRHQIAAREGDALAAGQVIGYLGDSGRARGTCQRLH